MSKWYVEGRIAMDGEPYYLVTDGSGDVLTALTTISERKTLRIS